MTKARELLEGSRASATAASMVAPLKVGPREFCAGKSQGKDVSSSDFTRDRPTLVLLGCIKIVVCSGFGNSYANGFNYYM